MQSFDKQFEFGKIGESYISNYFKAKGYAVLPIYEKEISEGKGPAVFFPDEEVIGTDMLIFKEDKTLWIEAKHKSAFSWHRLTQKWVTGIDIKHYNNYLKLQEKTQWPVWLLFKHNGGQDSPKGLFGNNLKVLSVCENHRHSGWGKYGMVYWAVENLINLTEDK